MYISQLKLNYLIISQYFKNKKNNIFYLNITHVEIINFVEMKNWLLIE